MILDLPFGMLTTDDKSSSLLQFILWEESKYCMWMNLTHFWTITFILYILSLFWPIRWQYFRNVMGRITMAMHKTKFLAWDLLTCNRTIRIIATTAVAIHVWFHPKRSQSTMIISWEAFSRGKKKTSQSPLTTCASIRSLGKLVLIPQILFSLGTSSDSLKHWYFPQDIINRP